MKKALSCGIGAAPLHPPRCPAPWYWTRDSGPFGALDAVGTDRYSSPRHRIHRAQPPSLLSQLTQLSQLSNKPATSSPASPAKPADPSNQAIQLTQQAQLHQRQDIAQQAEA